MLIGEGIKSTCSIPMISHDQALGTLSVGSLSEAAFNEDDARILTQVANQIAIAVENALAYRQIAELKDKLSEEKLYLQDEIRTEYNFEEIIGESPALKTVLEQLQTVAPTDSTILLLGETGTGKELIARAIHNLSARRERTLVKVNCAAIPTGLLESELFGHEKGAFTGADCATSRPVRTGAPGHARFWMRSATSRPDLQPEAPACTSGTGVRASRQRAHDPCGCSHGGRHQCGPGTKGGGESISQRSLLPAQRVPYNHSSVARAAGRHSAAGALLRAETCAADEKPIDSIAAKAMAALTEYHWPGNVRELENFIERSVILSRGPELQIQLAELKQRTKLATVASSDGIGTLEHAEREHIVRALGETNWVIGGPTGAAAKLGMKRTTLQSRMNKLGITRQN